VAETALRELLQRLEATWASQPDHRLAGRRPPRRAARRDGRAFASLGLVAPAEAIEWFGWHNGASVDADALRQPGIDGWALMSLEECVRAADMLRLSAARRRATGTDTGRPRGCR
jgi:hypothetical protein